MTTQELARKIVSSYPENLSIALIETLVDERNRLITLIDEIVDMGESISHREVIERCRWEQKR